MSVRQARSVCRALSVYPERLREREAGEISLPYEWQPSVVEIQILRAGQLLILCVPGELTTMAGRRLREAVQDQVRSVLTFRRALVRRALPFRRALEG